MTILSSDFLRSALAENALELNNARDDAAAYERMRNAAAEVKKLQTIGAELTKALSTALDTESAEERAKIAASVRNVTIATDYPSSNNKADLLGARFTINYERLTWNMRERDNVWTPLTVVGFGSLAPDVFGYILHSEPQLIPSCIMELAPRDPAAAVDRYLSAVQRGYL